MATMEKAVTRLPAEILREIFKLVHSMTEPRDTGIVGCSDQIHGVSSAGTGRKLAGVCTQWRAVALETRELWCWIDVQSSVDQLELGLIRSGNKLIHVSLHRPSPSLASWSLLAGHTDRLRSLTIAWRRCTAAQKKEFWELIGEVAVASLPVLEELGIDYFDVPDETEDRAELRGRMITLNETLLPALQVLCLRTVWLREAWESPLFSRLRVLHIEDLCLDESLWITMDQFLALLQECTQLEYLNLTHAYFVQFPSAGFPAPDSDRVIEFPALRRLHLEWDSAWTLPSAIYQMLDHFRLDPRTTLSIWSAYQPMCVPAHPRDPIHRLEDLIPRDPECLPITETATTLCLPSVPSHNMRFIATNSGDPDHGSLTVNLVHDCFESDDLGSDCDCADVQLEAILTIFSGASLQELELGSDAFSVSELSDDFRSLLPNLQTLDVSFTNPNSLEQVFEALTSLPDPTDLESEAESVVVLPELRTLRMKTFEWSPQLLEDIAKHLEWRSQRGTELSQLHLEVYGRPKDEEGGIGHDSQHNAQLARLQMVVNGPVEYVDAPSAPWLTADSSNSSSPSYVV